MSNKVYITKSSKYLPNQPIGNEDMEKYLGEIDGRASKARRIVLRNNGITTRYYALDQHQNFTHTNAQLTKNAIEQLFDESFSRDQLEILSCGTSTPDQLLPSHAAMVHGLLKGKTVELNASTGICCSGMNALKFAFLAILSGQAENAISTGSECVSPWMIAERFEKEIQSLKELEEQPVLAFKKDFLRWMLSDGAGAFLLQNKPNEKGISLQINWMDSVSYANELETCMYAGGEKLPDGSIKPWQHFSTDEWLKESIFSIKQDVKILDEYILKKGVESQLKVLEKRGVSVQDFDYFLPHISSYYFKEKLYQEFKDAGHEIPIQKWFLNLSKVGNVGAASIYVMVEELMNSGQLQKGERILLSVPESGRFSYAYAYLTVV